jgi:putative membrane protein
MIKNISKSLVLALAGFGLAACGTATNTTTTTNTNRANSNTGVVVNSDNTMSSNTMTNSTMNSSMNSTSNSSKNVSSADSEFMNKAAIGGMAEVELGKIASTKATSADVKQFGQQMMADHTRANTELKTLAASKNVTLPTELDAKRKEAMDKLSKLSGAAFDKEYVRMMVEDHEKDVADFEKQANGGTDSDVKSFASRTLPTLKMHLEMIKGINGKMK